MWWGILACSQPDRKVSELETRKEELQTELQTELKRLDERVGRVTSGVGELETRVDIRLAEVEARMEQMRKDLELRTTRASSAQAWLGTWNVQAEPISDLGCGDPPDPASFRFQVSGSAAQMAIAIEGNTRFQHMRGSLSDGVLTAVQIEGFDSSMVVLEQQGNHLAGFRVLTRLQDARPCTLTWKLSGQKP